MFRPIESLCPNLLGQEFGEVVEQDKVIRMIHTQFSLHDSHRTTIPQLRLLVLPLVLRTK